MYAPHTITVYNLTENPDTFIKEYNITVLTGVFLDGTQATNIKTSGLENADSVTVYIPFSVDAQGKTFLSEKRYEDSAEKQKHWTLRSKNDFFIKGSVVVPDSTYEIMNGRYDDVYRVSTVDTKDFGRAELEHWEVGGK